MKHSHDEVRAALGQVPCCGAPPAQRSVDFAAANLPSSPARPALRALQDENTRYIDIGPVNKVINMLACWFDDPDSDAFRRHIPRCAGRSRRILDPSGPLIQASQRAWGAASPKHPRFRSAAGLATGPARPSGVPPSMDPPPFPWRSSPATPAARRLQDYLWVAEDGMKMQGYNGSQLWDTSFAVQALAAASLGADADRCLRKAHDYIERSQVGAWDSGAIWLSGGLGQGLGRTEIIGQSAGAALDGGSQAWPPRLGDGRSIFWPAGRRGHRPARASSLPRPAPPRWWRRRSSRWASTIDTSARGLGPSARGTTGGPSQTAGERRAGAVQGQFI